MPWDGSANAGFTTGEPWLPIGTSNASAHVAGQTGDPASMLSLYRSLLDLRRSEPALSVGTFVPVAASERLLAYERRYAERRLLIALNFGAEPQSLEVAGSANTCLLSTYLDQVQPTTASSLTLRPHEGVVSEIS
jgi:alpha-glucosidase